MESELRRSILLELRLGKAAYANFRREVLDAAGNAATLHRARVTPDGAWLKVSLDPEIFQQWRDRAGGTDRGEATGAA